MFLFGGLDLFSVFYSVVLTASLTSAYHVLKCEQCTAEFGKMYKTTPSHLDDFRNRFTFNIDKIDS